ncbi:hypothetical protein F5888DRAFT_1121528 [Russula emetica]|nr:hypothetical protein F5888DRAFT_1121528 [Russula emetica]
MVCAQIGLPQDKDKLPLLCILDPFLTGNEVLVTPVVVLILDNTLKVSLCLFLCHRCCSHNVNTHASQPASAECPRSRHPLLAPTHLLPLHHIPRARRAQRTIPRSRSARRDSSRRTAIPHLQRCFRTLAF